MSTLARAAEISWASMNAVSETICVVHCRPTPRSKTRSLSKRRTPSPDIPVTPPCMNSLELDCRDSDIQPK